MKWINFEDQQHPSDSEHFENYKTTDSNAYLGVISIDKRGKKKEIVEPIYLWVDDRNSHYWTDAHNELVSPIKWALMPQPL